MEKEFIPYEEALALKELGFDELCFATYNSSKMLIFESGRRVRNSSYFWVLSAPLYQQAFSWFRDEHGNFYDIVQFKDDLWGYSIYGKIGFEAIFEHNKFLNYEEAELACLRKLIEIVKS